MTSSKPFFPSPKPPDLANNAAPPISFASVVAGPGVRPKLKARFVPLALPARQVGMKEGKPSISFSGAEIGACEKRFEHSIIAKFTVGRPRLAEIQRAFQENWPTAGRVSISEVWDSRHLLVIFDSEEDVRVALSSPLNKVGHAMFRLFRWYPDYNPKRESAITTIWVRLPGLPISIYDSAFIEAIVSTFGYFVSVDARTKACTALNMARACVELDVTKEIPNAVWISMPDNKSYWQTIEVESKIDFCGKCRLHGHNYDVCRKRKEWKANIGRNEMQSEGAAVDDKVQGKPSEPRNSGGVEYEWRKVVSRKQKKSQGEYPLKEVSQERPEESSAKEAPRVHPKTHILEHREDKLDKALVVYVESDEAKSKLCPSNPPLNIGVSGRFKKKNLMPFSNFIPKDLSGAERKIQNKANNVLFFNEDLGVFAHPDALPRYQQIRDKAGTARSNYVSSDMDTSEDDEEVITVREGEGSAGSKHYSSKMSK